MKVFAIVIFLSVIQPSLLYAMCMPGSFQAVSGSPFATESVPTAIAYSPVINGNLFAAITNSGNNSVSVYLVNQTTRAFTPVSGSPFATGADPANIVFSPVLDGQLFAAIANLDSNYHINIYC